MTRIRSVVFAGLAVALATLSPAEAARAKKHAPPPPAEAPAATAQSGAAQPLGMSDSWSAYQSADGTGPVCYLVGKPQKSEPANFARKPPMAMVTHRPAEKIANVISFVAGYPIKEGSEVTIEIGSGKFELFTKDDAAWARTAELDRAIVAALGKAKRVVVHGVPQKGLATTDIYALTGFAKALALIDKACAVKR
jgi:Invasion associated locus B (IalB) protein